MPASLTAPATEQQDHMTFNSVGAPTQEQGLVSLFAIMIACFVEKGAEELQAIIKTEKSLMHRSQLLRSSGGSEASF